MRAAALLLAWIPLGGCIFVAKGDEPVGAGAEAPPTHVQTVTTTRAPVPVGPYSQARLAGNTLYLAGQIGIDPATGDLVEGGIEAETRQAMTNLGAVLESAGFTFDDVVMAQVYLANDGDYDPMNRVYREYFSVTLPARTVVNAAPPKHASVEISMTAVRR